MRYKRLWLKLFCDIGLKSDTVDFELWKGLWYHNWGYTHWKSGEMVTPHIMWFPITINELKNSIYLEIQKKVL